MFNILIFSCLIKENAQPITGGLAQAGQWLARKFVQIWKFCARPNGSVSPACAKPLDVICKRRQRGEKHGEKNEKACYKIEFVPSYNKYKLK